MIGTVTGTAIGNSARQPGAPTRAWQAPRPSAILLATILLLFFGLLMMTSASVEIAESRYGDAWFHLRRQAIFAAIGIVVMLVTAHIPINFWNRLNQLLLIAAYAMLVLVLLPGFGHEVNGSTRWIDLGFITVQPSEPAKVLFVIFLASYFDRHRESVATSWMKFLVPLGLTGLAVALLQRQPDHGTMFILTLTALCMMFLVGVRSRRLLSLFVPAIGAIGLLALTRPYVLKRLTSFLDPCALENTYGAGYQLCQAHIAFGRGELFGLGLGNSIQKIDFLPETHNDFVLAVIGEELGLAGLALVILLFCILVWSCFSIAWQAQQRERFFSAYLAWGLGLLFAGQAMINIGVNLGLLPTKGLTLPFISYGGASLVVCCAMIGLLLRIQYESECIAESPASRRRRLS